MTPPRRTRDPRVWAQYGCWWVHFWMGGHQPILPTPLRNWAYDRWGGRRWSITAQAVRDWQRFGGMTPEQAQRPENRPLPWPFGPYALGPFVGTWRRVMHWFGRRTGGRSHRCEFTDRERGALWGHTEGPFMDRIFERFLENLDTLEEPEWTD